ncbi:MAG: DUF481 domain-containing protein [Thermoanaerobaculia bacterium]
MTLHTRALPLLVLLLVPIAARAQDEAEDGPPLGWSGSAELTFVNTTGNSETTTLGFGTSLLHAWEDARFTLEANGLRAESGTVTRRAVGTPQDFRILERSSSEVTAENYLVRASYDRDIREDFFWFSGLTWERNEFAGFSSRTSAVGGLGNLWLDRENAHWKTTYGVTWTSQDDLVDDPEVSSEFLGLRLTSDYGRAITATTDFASLLVVDQNLDDTDDLRADFTNSLAVSISERLALKISLQLLWDNQPALGEIALEAPDGTPTGDIVTYELDDLDTVLRTALVVKF